VKSRRAVPRAAFLAALFCAAAALCVSATGAFAQSDNQTRGFYIGGGLGPNWQEKNNFTGGGTNSSTEYETGGVGLFNFGYAYGNGLRFELEPGYRYNSVDKINGAAGRGETQIFSAMLNAVYDLPFTMPVVPLQPHVGGGIGLAHLWNRSGPHNGLTVKGTDDALALQVIAGSEYSVTPALKLGLDYRFFTARDTAFPIVGSSVRSKAGDFDDHSVLFTVRYLFGAAPRAVPPVTPATLAPAPPAPPPSLAPRNYVVYFDFDRSELTADAKPIVQRAAQDAKDGKVTRIQVTGHTDLAGSVPYNQKLSERRAATVRAALIAAGVPADEIVTLAKGKTEPAVPTPDGVREPRNRRVEIVLQQPGS
jgi:OOP family OmpA-OmpF porin